MFTLLMLCHALSFQAVDERAEDIVEEDPEFSILPVFTKSLFTV